MEFSVLSFLDGFCRICAKKRPDLSCIFDHELLPMKLFRCFQVHVSESDGLPVKICQSCFFEVEKSYDLLERFFHAEKKLKKLFKISLRTSTGDMLPPILSNYENDLFTDVLYTNSDKLPSPANAIVTMPPEDVYECGEAKLAMYHGEAAKNNLKIRIIVNPDDMTSIENEVVYAGETRETYGCQHCNEKFLVKSELRKHTKEVHGSNRPFQCIVCSREFSSSSGLSIHKATHSKERAFLCEICGKCFKHGNNLRSHSRRHAFSPKLFDCYICERSFYSKYFLREHMNSHTGETPYKCTECKKAFRERIHLRQHMWTHSPDKFVCSICGSRFNRKGNLAEHIKKYHLKNKENFQNSKAAVVAEHSEVCPASQSSVKRVLPIQPQESSATAATQPVTKGVFSCPLCNKTFRHKGSLTYHRRSHTGERPYSCTFCTDKFPLRSVQKIHERKVHTGEQPYKCQFWQCRSQFSTSSALRNHSFTHSPEKLFSCDMCGDKFTRKRAVLIHKKIHTGIRDFGCDQCDRKFYQKSDMLRHRKTHDPKRKPFFCKSCGNSFSRRADISKHATCRLNLTRRSTHVIDTSQAERMLDSASHALRATLAGEEFLENDLIQDSVNQFSSGRLDI